MADERNCIMCVRWHWYPGWGGTEVTPGDSWSSACTEGVWRLTGDDVTEADWREAISKAETCKLFKEAGEDNG